MNAGSPMNLEEVVAADAQEWVERIRGRLFPWDDDRYYRDFITSGLALAHRGHDGIPGAPDSAWCARCEADRALDRLIATGRAAGRPPFLNEALAYAIANGYDQERGRRALAELKAIDTTNWSDL